jgi:hypothetical protein
MLKTWFKFFNFYILPIIVYIELSNVFIWDCFSKYSWKEVLPIFSWLSHFDDCSLKERNIFACYLVLQMLWIFRLINSFQTTEIIQNVQEIDKC